MPSATARELARSNLQTIYSSKSTARFGHLDPMS
jgi:hypothetical protein